MHASCCRETFELFAARLQAAVQSLCDGLHTACLFGSHPLTNSCSLTLLLLCFLLFLCLGDETGELSGEGVCARRQGVTKQRPLTRAPEILLELCTVPTTSH